MISTEFSYFWTEINYKLFQKIGFQFKIKADPRFKPQAYIEYIEDSKRGSNTDIGLEDIFEMASKNRLSTSFQSGGQLMELTEFLKTIVWLGHDGFRIAGTKTIYFDPFQIASTKKADIILVSHEHYDHCSPDDIARIQQDDTIIITEKDSAKKLSGNVRVVTPGEVLTIEGVTVTVVPAYNVDKKFHPKSKGWLGFIVEIDGVRVYHAGDTDFIPEMKDFQVDVALLPVSGTYVMTAAEAIQAARAIRPRVVIPMHYGAIVGDEKDAAFLNKSLSDEMEVVMLKQEK